MTTTIARQARIRFADETAPLAKVVASAQAAAEAESLAAELIADIETYLAGEFEFDCQMCGDGCDEIFRRITEDGERVEACESCVNKHGLAYCED